MKIDLKETIIQLILTLLLAACFGLILSSCRTVHKSMQEAHTDSTVMRRSDTLSTAHKDSVFSKTRTEENVSEIILEGDSLTYVAPLSNYHPADNVQAQWPVYRESVRAQDYFHFPVGGIKKITIRTSQKDSTMEGGRLTSAVIQAGHKEDSARIVRTNIVQTESKRRCSFPYVWIVVVGALLYWLWHRYRTLFI